MGFGSYDEDKDQEEKSYDEKEDQEYEIPGQEHDEGETSFEFDGMDVQQMLDKADT